LTRPEPFVYTSSVATEKDDVFHFVGYLHFKNNVYEIDGLQEGPILICENVKNEEWIEKVKPSIVSRINLYSQNEIKFNLLSIVPDRKQVAQKEEDNLLGRKQYIIKKLSGTSENSGNNNDIEVKI
jgi:ubiquitin carboxyl-terminal hydrolase L5